MAPTAATTTARMRRRMSARIRGPALVRRCVWRGVCRWGRRRPAQALVEEVLQDDRGGGGVEPGLALPPVPLARAQAALGFDAGQALVLDEHRQRGSRPEPGDEGVDLRGFVAGAAIEVQRPAHHDGRQPVRFGGELVRRSQDLGERRLRGDDAVRGRQGAGRVAQGKTGAPPADIQGEHATGPDGTRHVGSLPECTRSWKRHIRSRARGSSRDRDGGPRRPAGRAAGVRLRARTAPHPRPGVTEGPRREAGAQAKAEATRPAVEQRTLLTRLREIELAIETRELEREKTARARTVATAAVDAAVDRVAAADAELASLMPEVRARLARLYRLMPLGYDRLLFSLEDARTFDRAARVVAVLARRDREQLERFTKLRASRAAEVARLERDTLDMLTQRLAGEEAALAENAGIQQRLLADVRERRDLNAHWSVSWPRPAIGSSSRWRC